MTTIYAVNSGEYSDYGIDGVFSSRENAEKYMHAFPKEGYGGYNDIQELELDQYLAEIDRGLTHWVVLMYRSGNVHDARVSEYVGLNDGKIHWIDKAYWSPPEPWANFYVWANDREHAIKVANERRIMLLAQG